MLISPAGDERFKGFAGIGYDPSADIEGLAGASVEREVLSRSGNSVAAE
jgi:hypothetical protein